MKTSSLKSTLLTGLSTLVCAFGLHATNLTWDADPLTTAPQDGPGVWDTTTNTWWDGAANVTWNNATPDNATFGAGPGSGTAGPVTVAAGLTINVGNLTFNTPNDGNYNLTTGDANSRLSFTPSSIVTVASGLTITNTVVLTGSSSFTKAGPGTFSLRPGTPNLNTGLTIVTDGTLVMGSSGNRVVIPGDLIVTNTGVARLGADNTITNTATVSVAAGATFDMNTRALRVPTFILNGGTVIQGASEALTVDNFDARAGVLTQTVGTGSKLDGNLTKTTSGTVSLTSRGSASLSGLTNTTVNDGTLILDYGYQNGSKLADVAGVLSMNGGTLVFTNGTATETLASVILAGGVITNASGAVGTVRLSVASPGSYDVRAGAVYMVLAGTAGLVKSTGGTVILGAASVTNNYSGGTVINGGTLLINGVCSSSGNSVTVNNSGTLGGNGIIKGNVTVDVGGTLAPGAATGLIGELTTDLALSLNGHMVVDVNKSGATLTNDSVAGINSVTFGGDMTVNKTGDALTVGDSFSLFNTGGTGDFTSITPAPGAGLAWDFEPTTGVLSVVSAGGGSPTLNVAQTGSTLTFSWTGSFKLQSQTNSLAAGLQTNPASWFDYPGGTVSGVTATINPANPTVFFRLSE